MDMDISLVAGEAEQNLHPANLHTLDAGQSNLSEKGNPNSELTGPTSKSKMTSSTSSSTIPVKVSDDTVVQEQSSGPDSSHRYNLISLEQENSQTPRPTEISNGKPPPTTLVAFTLFSFLPTELRRKIWSHALPPPTIHTISLPTCSCTLPYTSPHIHPLPNTFISSFSTPRLCPRQHVPRTLSSLSILLQVSHEARDVCLNHCTILESRLGKGFHLAIDREKDALYFSNGRGPSPEKKFWSVSGMLPDCVSVASYSKPLLTNPRSSPSEYQLSCTTSPSESQEGRYLQQRAQTRRVKHLVIDEATLSRKDYLRFPVEVLGLESVTVLLMPWTHPPSSPTVTNFNDSETELIRTIPPTLIPSSVVASTSEARALEVEHPRAWGEIAVRSWFLGFLEEQRELTGLRKVPKVRVARWGACLQDAGEGEGWWGGRSGWMVVEKGLWVEWVWVGR